MHHRGHSTWSQHHRGLIATGVTAGTMTILVLVLLCVFLPPIGIACLIAFLAGMHNVRQYAKPLQTICCWCGQPEPRQAIGWRMIYGAPCCPNHPW